MWIICWTSSHSGGDGCTIPYHYPRLFRCGFHKVAPTGPVHAGVVGRPDEIDRFFSEICDVNEHSPDHPIQVRQGTIRLFPTVHYIPTCAVRVELAHGVVAYTADTGPTANLSELARDADLLIAESMLVGPFNDIPSRGSSTPEEAASLGRNAGAKRLLLTHFWSQQDANEALPRARRIFSGPVEVARPGLTISWE